MPQIEYECAKPVINKVYSFLDDIVKLFRNIGDSNISESEAQEKTALLLVQAQKELTDFLRYRGIQTNEDKT